jgi:hypothetical protein
VSNVVAFRVPMQRSSTEAFADAWKAYPAQGRLRSSQKQAAKAWALACRDVGAEALLAAVRRYVAEDKEHKRECGPPGFHRWLAWGRYEHWLEPAVEEVSDRPRFADELIRRQVVLATSEAFAVSYLDRCTVEGSTLIAATQTAVDKMLEKRAVFRSLGFTGIRKAKG